MKIISLDKIYDFYCDWYFHYTHGYAGSTIAIVEKYNIISTNDFLATFIFDMASDDFGDFCDAIRKSGVVIE